MSYNYWVGGARSPSVHQPTSARQSSSVHQRESAGQWSTKEAGATAPGSSDYDEGRQEKLEEAINNEMEIIGLVLENLRLSVKWNRLTCDNGKLFVRAFANLRWARRGVNNTDFENVGSGNSELLLNSLSILLSLTNSSNLPCTIDSTFARSSIRHQLSSCESWKFRNIVEHQETRKRTIRERIKLREDNISMWNAQSKSAPQRYSYENIQQRAIEFALCNCEEAFCIFLHHETEKITKASSLLKSAYEVFLNPNKVSSMESRRDEELKEVLNKDAEETYNVKADGLHCKEKEDVTTLRSSSEKRDVSASCDSSNRSAVELQEELERCKTQLAERDAHVKSLEQGLRDLNKKATKAQLALERLHQQCDVLQQAKKSDEEELTRLKEERKSLTDQISGQQIELKKAEERGRDLEEKATKAQLQCDALQQAKKSDEEKLTKLEEERKSLSDQISGQQIELKKAEERYSKQNLALQEAVGMLSQSQRKLDELQRVKENYVEKIAKLEDELGNQSTNYLQQISTLEVEKDEEMKRCSKQMKRAQNQADESNRRLQDKVKELKSELSVREAELQEARDEFSQYKYKVLVSAINKESANYPDLNDTLRPGKVIEMHKDLRVGEYLKVMDYLESEEKEIFKRMLNSIVQESYDLVSERSETCVKALTTAYRSITEDIDAVHEFEMEMKEKVKSDWKKDIDGLLTNDSVKEVLRRADSKDFTEDLQEKDVVTDYVKVCLQFAFSLCVQTPQFQLDSSPQPFDKNRHELELGRSETSKSVIDYFIWPTLICNDEENRVLRKGIVHLK